MTPDDDLLSAYLDSGLPDPQLQALERLLADDPALQRRLDVLRTADEKVAEIMDRVLAEPVPLSLVRALTRRGPPVGRWHGQHSPGRW